MSYLFWAVPVALLTGLTGIAAFTWALRNAQYQDLDGEGDWVLLDDESACSIRTAIGIHRQEADT